MPDEQPANHLRCGETRTAGSPEIISKQADSIKIPRGDQRLREPEKPRKRPAGRVLEYRRELHCVDIPDPIEKIEASALQGANRPSLAFAMAPFPTAPPRTHGVSAGIPPDNDVSQADTVDQPGCIGSDVSFRASRLATQIAKTSAVSRDDQRSRLVCSSMDFQAKYPRTRPPSPHQNRESRSGPVASKDTVLPSASSIWPSMSCFRCAI